MLKFKLVIITIILAPGVYSLMADISWQQAAKSNLCPRNHFWIDGLAECRRPTNLCPALQVPDDKGDCSPRGRLSLPEADVTLPGGTVVYGDHRFHQPRCMLPEGRGFQAIVHHVVNGSFHFAETPKACGNHKETFYLKPIKLAYLVEKNACEHILAAKLDRRYYKTRYIKTCSIRRVASAPHR